MSAWMKKKAAEMLGIYVGQLESGRAWPSADECGAVVQAYYAVDLLTDAELKEWSRRIHLASTARKAS